ncbi:MULTISPECIES: hypothetical protein [unclassified Bradyrhizobium]|uniref:hypothetical protein n=1 Tax=unclassified Bradyrhizobium TaxID=2631580 RepID=UPI002916B5B2|nr:MULTISPECIES: hypothetical protein [unclassified Bradyrhizobium]
MDYFGYAARNHLGVRPGWFRRPELLSGTAHTTLLRMPPLRLWSLQPKIEAENREKDAVLRQTAIIVAGLAIGLVVQRVDGGLEVLA